MQSVLTSAHDADVGLWDVPLVHTTGNFGQYSIHRLPAVGTGTGLRKLIECLTKYLTEFFMARFNLGLCVGALAPCALEPDSASARGPGSASSSGNLPSAWKKANAAHSICIQFESVGFDILFARLYIVWDTRKPNKWRIWKIAKLAIFLPLAEATNFMDTWCLWRVENPLRWGEEGASLYELGVQMDPGDWPTAGLQPEGLPERYGRLWPDIPHMMQRHALQALKPDSEDINSALLCKRL
jgi:hypothetical protein